MKKLILTITLFLSVVNVWGQTYSYSSQFGSAGSGNGQFKSPEGIVVDNAGNIYVADNSNYRIQKFNSSGIYVSQFGTYGTGNGQFADLFDLTIDPNGNIFVADYLNHRIQKFTSTGIYITQFGSFGTGNGQFNRALCIASDANGNIYVSDYFNHRIQKFDNNGVYLSQFGTSGSGDGQFNQPYGIAVDGSGNIFIADHLNHRIQKFNSEGQYISKFGTNGTGIGQLRNPTDITVDNDGNIFVADYYNAKVHKFDNSGVYITQIGGSGSGNGLFSNITGVAVDLNNNLLISDVLNQRIQKFNIQKLSQTITGLSNLTKNNKSAAFNLTATASSGLNVTYTSSDTTVAKIVGNTVTIKKAGTATITASQAGNTSYSAAADVTATLTVFDIGNIPSNGLLAYYPFNGNANDESGNSNNGTVNGATITVDKFANTNTAYSFDGVNNYISCNPLLTNINTGFSISVWVKPSLITTNRYYEIVRQENVATSLDYLLSYQEYGNVLSFGINTSNGNYTELDINITPSQHQDQKWHHITATYDGTKRNVYFDGSLVGTDAKTGTNNFKGGKLAIGSRANFSEEFFKGSLDEFAFYNRALTLAEITAIYSYAPKSSQTITGLSNLTKNNKSAAFNLTATASSGLTVTYTSSDTSIAKIVGNTVTIKKAGTSTITASQAGNASYTAATDVTATLTVFDIGNIPSIGLVAYYPFNGNAKDESGNGNDGTVNGATLTNDRTGKGNSSYSFDGNNDISINPLNFPSGNSPRTISLWYKSNLIQYENLGGCLFSYGATANNAAFGVFIKNTAATSNIWVSTWNPTFYGNNKSLTDNWKNVTITYDGNRVKVYSNGVKDIDTLYNIQTSNSMSYIGKWVNGTFPFKGAIDDVSIFNRALTSNEVTALFTNGSQTITGLSNITKNNKSTPFNLTATASSGLTVTYTSSDTTVAKIVGNTVTIKKAGTTTITASQAGDATYSAATDVTATLTIFDIGNIPSNGLIAYYPFNGNAKDESGNGNDGTVNGATLTNDRTGKGNSSYSFDGTSNINLGKSNVFSVKQGTQLSVSLWVKPSEFTKVFEGGNIIFSKNHFNQPYGNLLISASGWTSDGNTFGMMGQNANGILIYKNGNINNWYHIVSIYDGINIDSSKLYVNGILIAKGAQNLNTIDSDNNAYLGYGESNNGWPSLTNFKGLIDDASFYNRVLTSNEVATLYSNAPQTITGLSNITKNNKSAAFNLTATASSGLTVTYTSSDTTVAKIVGNTVTIKKAGTTNITASQAGNVSYSAATDVTATLTVFDIGNIPTNGLMAYYPFNGNANDESGNGFHGTINGASLTSDRNGKANSTYSFDGTDGFTAPGNQYPNVTYSVWFNKTNNKVNAPAEIVFETCGAGSPVHLLSDKKIKFSLEVNGGNYNYFTTSDTVITYKWYHAVVSFDGSTISYYLDGKLLKQIANNGQINYDGCGTLFAGRQWISNSIYHFNGLIDDISIYSRAITASEVTAIYSNGPKTSQTIIGFSSLIKTTTETPFSLTASSSSGLPVVYTSSDTSVAFVLGNTVIIKKAGTTTITASQSGNDEYAATEQKATLKVLGIQMITGLTDITKINTIIPFSLYATASSGLPVVYTSSDTTVASIIGNTVTIKKAGITTITASQPGNSEYAPASDQSATLTVLGIQIITGLTDISKTEKDVPFNLSATASSGLPVIYTSSDTTVASINGNIVTIKKAGIVTITASQPGNNEYTAATEQTATLTVLAQPKSSDFSFSKINNPNIPQLAYSESAFGDMDGDGDLDLVLSGYDGNALQGYIYINNGNGIFASTPAFNFAGLYNGNIDINDLNNDKKLDFIISGIDINGIPHTVIYINNGNSKFTIQNTNIPNIGNGKTKAFDFNNDGMLDIFTTGKDSSGNNIAQLYYANNKFEYTLSDYHFIAQENPAFDCGDINQDGFIDIAYMGGSDANGYNSGVYYATKNNSFENKSILTGAGMGEITIANLNDDIYPDILQVGYGSWGQGAIYSYQIKTDVFSQIRSGSGAWGVAAAVSDFNGDWKTDYLYSGNKTQKIGQAGMLIGQTSGFGVSPYQPLPLLSSSIAIGDIDNDGKIDYFHSGADSNGVFYSAFYKNTTNYTPITFNVPTNLKAKLPTVNDASVSLSWDAQYFNETYNVEIYDAQNNVVLSSNQDNNNFRTLPKVGNTGWNSFIKIYLPQGKYNWRVQAIDPSLNPSDFSEVDSFEVVGSPSDILVEKTPKGFPILDLGTGALADVNNDGDLDAIVSGIIGSTVLNESEDGGTSQFSEIIKNISSSLSIDWAGFEGGFLGGIQPVDFDNDGDIDFLANGRKNNASDLTYLYKNNGNYTFQKIVHPFENIKYDKSRFFDYDNDGDQDVLICGESDNGGAPTFLYENIGNDQFVRNTSDFGRNFNPNVDVGDMDNDGWVDVVISSYYYKPIIYWYKNNGNNTFTKTELSLTPLYSGDLKLADIDGDRDLDIINIGASKTGNYAYVGKNQGNGVFSEEALPSEMPTALGTISLVDIDLDLDIDIMLSGIHKTDSVYEYGNGKANLLLNQGGSFITSSMKFANYVYYGKLIVGDINQDSRPDLTMVGRKKGVFGGDIGVFDYYENNLTTQFPLVYEAPKNLKATIKPNNEVLLSWDSVSTKGLAYNIEVIDSTGKRIVASNVSSDGLTNYLANMGNNGLSNFKILNHLQAGKYQFRVQCVTPYFKTGKFSDYLEFEITDSLVQPLFTESPVSYIHDNQINNNILVVKDFDEDGKLDLATVGYDSKGWRKQSIYKAKNCFVNPSDLYIHGSSFAHQPMFQWESQNQYYNRDLIVSLSSTSEMYFTADSEIESSYVEDDKSFSSFPTRYYSFGRIDNNSEVKNIIQTQPVASNAKPVMYVLAPESGEDYEDKFSAQFHNKNNKLVDFDKDGDLDLLTTQYLFINNEGDFELTNFNPAATLQFSSWIDIDSDGWMDISTDDINQVYLNKRNGTFLLKNINYQYPVPQGLGYVLYTRDLDQDNINELIICPELYDTKDTALSFIIFKGTRNLTYSEVIFEQTNAFVFDFELADFDNNGSIDFALSYGESNRERHKDNYRYKTNKNDYNVSVFYNKATPKATPPAVDTIITKIVGKKTILSWNKSQFTTDKYVVYLLDENDDIQYQDFIRKDHNKKLYTNAYDNFVNDTSIVFNDLPEGNYTLYLYRMNDQLACDYANVKAYKFEVQYFEKQKLNSLKNFGNEIIDLDKDGNVELVTFTSDSLMIYSKNELTNDYEIQSQYFLSSNLKRSNDLTVQLLKQDFNNDNIIDILLVLRNDTIIDKQLAAIISTGNGLEYEVVKSEIFKDAKGLGLSKIRPTQSFDDYILCLIEKEDTVLQQIVSVTASGILLKDTAMINLPKVLSLTQADLEGKGDMQYLTQTADSKVFYTNSANNWLQAPLQYAVALRPLDYNWDGKLDFVYASGSGTNVMEGGEFGFSKSSLPWSQYESSIWHIEEVDFYNTGTPKILSTGQANPGRIKMLNYKNEELSDLDLLDQSSIVNGFTGIDYSLGDINNDNKIDLLLSKSDRAHYILNDYVQDNEAPSVPDSLEAQVKDNSVTLNWAIANDDVTPNNGITYDVRVFNDTKDLVEISSIVETGKRIEYKKGYYGNNIAKFKNLPDGKYYWQVQAIDGQLIGSALSVVDSFEIKNDPVISGDTLVCQHQTSIFSALPSDQVYQWQIDTAYAQVLDSLKGATVRIKWKKSGETTVKLINTTYHKTQSLLVSVKENPQPDFTSTLATDTNVTIYKFKDSTSLPIQQWSWRFVEENSIDTHAIVTHDFKLSGVYHVMLNAQYENGCVNSVEKTLQVLYPQLIGPDSGICAGQVYNFNVIPLGYRYLWNFEGARLVDKNDVLGIRKLVWDSAGTYSVGVNNYFNTKNFSANKSVVVHPTPNVKFELPNTVNVGEFISLVNLSDATAFTHWWQFGENGQTSTDKNPFIAFKMAGVHQVTLTETSTAGCVNKSTKEIIVGNVVQDIKISNLLTPNADGVNDILKIENIERYPNNILTFTDEFGNVVFSQKSYSNDWDLKVNGSCIPEGTYYCKVQLLDINKSFESLVSIIK